MKKLTPEQREILKGQIINSAKENNITVLEQITYMQSKCAERKQDGALDILCDLKTDFIKY